MTDLNSIWSGIQSGVEQLAKQTFSDLKDAAVSDATDFLNETKDNLTRWTDDLISGKLSKDELESLINGQKDLGEMKLLKDAGIALIELDKFKQGVMKIAFDAITKLVP